MIPKTIEVRVRVWPSLGKTTIQIWGEDREGHKKCLGKLSAALPGDEGMTPDTATAVLHRLIEACEDALLRVKKGGMWSGNGTHQQP